MVQMFQHGYKAWDDVTGNDTNRGRIRISKANSLDTWMVFKVTGSNHRCYWL